MSNTNVTTKASFTVGQTVRTWEPKGCRELKGGPSSSERCGGEYLDIMPTEELLVVQKLGSTRAIVERADGQRISMHLNHINPDSSYYALRGQRSGSQAQKTVQERKAEAIAKIQQAKKELEELVALQAEAEAMAIDEADKATDEESVSQDSRDEAKALFEAAV